MCNCLRLLKEFALVKLHKSLIFKPMRLCIEQEVERRGFEAGRHKKANSDIDSPTPSSIKNNDALREKWERGSLQGQSLYAGAEKEISKTRPSVL
jgi:hypothetical protein